MPNMIMALILLITFMAYLLRVGKATILFLEGLIITKNEVGQGIANERSKKEIVFE